jgi:hypothetical protein
MIDFSKFVVNPLRGVSYCRLRQVISDMEAESAILVRPEVVDKHLETIESLQSEVRQLDHTHKQLIVRYVRLKSAIEAASTTPNKDAGTQPMK